MTTSSEEKRQAWLSKMAEYVLAHGLQGASLRPLAQAAGTSDRMLIYHFGSKDALLAQLLALLATRLSDHLTAALPPGRAPNRAACVREILALLRTPAVWRYLRLWLEIVAAASQGQANQIATGRAMIAMFFAWLERRVPAREPDKQAAARAILTFIEGAIVMEAVGQGAAADEAVTRLFGP